MGLGLATARSGLGLLSLKLRQLDHKGCECGLDGGPIAACELADGEPLRSNEHIADAFDGKELAGERVCFWRSAIGAKPRVRAREHCWQRAGGHALQGVGVGRWQERERHVTSVGELKKLIERPELEPMRACMQRPIVAIDAGANRGDITAWLLAHPLFAASHEARALALEANPQLVPALQARFAGARAEVRHAAVWTHEQGIELFVTDPQTDPQRVGATVCEGKWTNNVNYERGLPVPSIDLAKLLIELAVTTDAKVLLKLDIEGAEYAVVEHLLARGALTLVDALVIETHVHKVRSITSQRHAAVLAALQHWAGEPVAQHTTWRGYAPNGRGRDEADRDLVGLLRQMLAADTRAALVAASDAP